MATIQEIITYADRKYPNQETDANKVLDLDDIHKDIFTIVSRLSNDYTTDEDVTVADQATYALPADCMMNNIIAIKTSASATVTTSTAWNSYTFTGVNDDDSYGYCWGYSSKGYIWLHYNGLPIATDDLELKIFYYPTPATLVVGSLSAVPALDVYYHSLLKYALIQSLAAQGQNPDTDIADYWQAKFDEFMNKIEKNLSENYSQNPSSNNQIQEVW